MAQIEAALDARGAGRQLLALLAQDERAGVRRLALRERRRFHARTAERRRRRQMRDLESRYWAEGLTRVAGVDEVLRVMFDNPYIGNV